jgi:hypothetical protein
MVSMIIVIDTISLNPSAPAPAPCTHQRIVKTSYRRDEVLSKEKDVSMIGTSFSYKDRMLLLQSPVSPFFHCRANCRAGFRQVFRFHDW